MSWIFQWPKHPRRAMILPTAMILGTLLISVLGLLTIQGVQRVQTWHELHREQHFQAAFLIAKHAVADGSVRGRVIFGPNQSATWELNKSASGLLDDQRRILVRLVPTGEEKSKPIATIF